MLHTNLKLIKQRNKLWVLYILNIYGKTARQNKDTNNHLGQLLLKHIHICILLNVKTIDKSIQD